MKSSWMYFLRVRRQTLKSRNPMLHLKLVDELTNYKPLPQDTGFKSKTATVLNGSVVLVSFYQIDNKLKTLVMRAPQQ